MKSLRIIAIGDELLNGAVYDTNSRTIAIAFENAGFTVDSITVVPDRLPEIVKALSRDAGETDLIITTGGLGPTTDDLTRNAIAEFVGKPLLEDSAARTKLEDLFKKRGRAISENNYRQIFFPKDSLVLTNKIGTADGFVSFPATPQPPVVSLPGVPRELTWLLDNQVLPWVRSHFGDAGHQIERRYLRVFGLSESYLGTRIEELHLPSEIKISYRPNSPEILLTISASTKVSESPLSPAVEKILTAIGSDFVFSTSAHNSMAEEVVRILNESGNTIAVAESCSGGKIADLLTSIPGVSNCFLASAVTYSNQSKSSLVEVNPATIEGYGAISPETAKEMAIGIKKRTGATIGISATGIAGPDGGSDDKPVGTFYIGIATAKGADTYKFFMSTERNLFRRYVAFTALDLVRRQLTGLPLDWRRQ